VSQVNLLPPEIRQRARIRQRTAVVAVIAVAVLLLIFAFYLLQSMELSRVQDDVAAQEQTNSGLQTQIAALQRFGDDQAELKEKRDLLAAVYENEIAWSGVLVDVSRTIPDDAVLTDMSGQSAVADEAAAIAPAPGTATLVGSLTFTGQVREADTLALWLSQLQRVKGWENPFVSTAAETEDRSRIYDFSSSVDLFPGALTKRGRGEEQPA
jgi:Tfp pilus assembly protein PilN